MELPLNYKIDQYYNLKQMGENIGARLKDLGDEIKQDLEEGTHHVGEYKVAIQVKDRTRLDQSAAWEVLQEQGFDPWEFTVSDPVLDPGKIEQEYLLGNLTDVDLRRMRDPQYSVALRVEKNVQS